MNQRLELNRFRDELVFATPGDARPGEAAEALPRREALECFLDLARWEWDSVALRRAELIRIAGWVVPLGPDVWRHDETWLEEQIAEALVRGDLLLVRRFVPWPIPPGSPAPAPPATPSDEPTKPDEKLKWIELELVDTEGVPVPNIGYRLTPASGPARTGRLNGMGFARVEGLEPLEYKVTFPEIDGREWWKA